MTIPNSSTGPPASTQLHVPARLLGTPLLVSKGEADLILAALHGPLPAGMFFPFLETEKPKGIEVKNGVAIIPVMGGLTYRGYGWYWRSTYKMVRNQFREAMSDPDVQSILFDIDSPGGEAAGVFDLVDEIHAARGQKPIYAVANENAFSAAYAIASAADKVYLPRTGAAGSIGVIAIHYEQSKAEADVGVTYTAIFAGDRKNDFSIHEPISKEALSIAQASVDKTNDLFLETVARNRGLSVDAVREQQAAIYDGADAVSAGLADGVNTFEAVLSELSQTHTHFNKGGNRMDLEQLVAELSAAQIGVALAAGLSDTGKKEAVMEVLSKMGFSQADPAGTDAALADAEKKGAKAATERAVTIAEKCVLAGYVQMAPQLIGEDITVNVAATRILEAKHNDSPDNNLDNTNSGLQASGADYLMADAKRRAGKKL